MMKVVARFSTSYYHFSPYYLSLGHIIGGHVAAKKVGFDIGNAILVCIYFINY